MFTRFILTATRAAVASHNPTFNGGGVGPPAHAKSQATPGDTDCYPVPNTVTATLQVLYTCLLNSRGRSFMSNYRSVKVFVNAAKSSDLT